MAAGDRQIAIRIKAIAAVGVGCDRPAGDVQCIGKIRQIGVGGIDAVIGGLNISTA